MFVLKGLPVTVALFASGVVGAFRFIDLQEDYLYPFSARYNGTVTVTEHTTQTNKPECNGERLKRSGYMLSLGGPLDTKTYQGKNYTRSNWDSNPFWFFLEDLEKRALTLVSTEGGTLTSDSSKYDEYKMWEIQSTKSGDGIDFTAKYSTPYEQTKDRNRYSFSSCITNLISQNVHPGGWTMTGHISPSKATLEFGPQDWEASGWQLSQKWKFEGTWNKNSATLSVDDNAKVHTEGVIEAYKKDVGGGSALRSSGVLVWGSVLMGVVAAIF